MIVSPNAVVVKDTLSIQRMVEAYRARPDEAIYFDIETTGLSPFTSRIAALQFRQGERKTTIIDTRSMDYETLMLIGSILSPLFDGTIEVVGLNIKFDLSFLYSHLAITAHRVFDVMVAEQVIRGLGMSGARALGISFGMEGITQRYNLTVSKEERSWFIDLDQRDEWNTPFPTEQIDYMVQDVVVLNPIRMEQVKQISRFGLMQCVDLEMRAIPAIVGMEVMGVYIDQENWRVVIERTKKEAAELEGKVLEEIQGHVLAVRTERFDALFVPWSEWKSDRDWAMALAREEYIDKHLEGWGEERKAILKRFREFEPRRPVRDTSLVNVGSAAQIKDALNHMSLMLIGSDQPLLFDSVSSDVLQEYEDAFPIISLIMEHRKANKLVSSFGESLLSKIHPDTGRLYASYHQIGADTGRMSSHDPNFQQIPGSGIGAQLRECVVAKHTNQFVIADFSNIELRILAELSRDVRMLSLFASGADLHAETARMMFGLAVDADVTVDAVINGRTIRAVSYRKIAKTINFGLVYGMSASKLSRTLRISLEAAKQLMTLYFNLYPGVNRWLKEQHKRVDDAVTAGKGMCQSRTVTKRVRWYRIPDPPSFPVSRDVDSIQGYKMLCSEYKGTIAGIRRKLANSPIQGSSCDITKMSMALWHEACGYNPHMRLVAAIHDELIVEATDGHEEAAVRLLAKCMDEAQTLYLKVVAFPKTTPTVTKHWTH